MDSVRLEQIELLLGAAITDEREAPLTMRNTVRCAAAARELLAEVQRLKARVEEERRAAKLATDDRQVAEQRLAVAQNALEAAQEDRARIGRLLDATETETPHEAAQRAATELEHLRRQRDEHFERSAAKLAELAHERHALGERLDIVRETNRQLARLAEELRLRLAAIGPPQPVVAILDAGLDVLTFLDCPAGAPEGVLL